MDKWFKQMPHKRYRMKNKHEKIPNIHELNLYLSNELAILLKIMSSYTYKDIFMGAHVLFTFESQQLEKHTSLSAVEWIYKLLPYPQQNITYHKGATIDIWKNTAWRNLKIIMMHKEVSTKEESVVYAKTYK